MGIIKRWFALRREGDEPVPEIDRPLEALVDYVVTPLVEKALGGGEPQGYSYEEDPGFHPEKDGKIHYEREPIVIMGHHTLRINQKVGRSEVERLGREGKLYVVRRERE